MSGRGDSRSEVPAAGNRSSWVLTGTGPVLSMRASIASCSRPSNSASSSSSSGCWPSGTLVIAWPISSLSTCCSRRTSLDSLSQHRFIVCATPSRHAPHVHCLVDLVDAHSTVDLRHRRTGLLHSLQGLVVDVRGLDRVYLLFQLHDLR